MKSRISQRLILVTTLTCLLCASVALSYDAPRHPVVFERMLAMNDASRTLTRLSNMANGRAIFHPDRARFDRRALIRFTRRIHRLFRRNKMDTHSRALPLIWENRTEFRARAQFATIAARGLNTRSIDTLRQTLPGLLQTCLDCHSRFRAPDR